VAEMLKVFLQSYSTIFGLFLILYARVLPLICLINNVTAWSTAFYQHLLFNTRNIRISDRTNV